jgi:hypothetical protein
MKPQTLQKWFENPSGRVNLESYYALKTINIICIGWRKYLSSLACMALAGRNILVRPTTPKTKQAPQTNLKGLPEGSLEEGPSDLFCVLVYHSIERLKI